MSKLIVLSETNCLAHLRTHGLEPEEFYTDLETFRKSSVFFDDVIIMVIFVGSCSFPKAKTDELLNSLRERADSDVESIADLIIVSDAILPKCKDYFLYQTSPLRCVRYSGWKATSNLFNLARLNYEHSPVTKTFLTSADKGHDFAALKKVREVNETEKALIDLIKVPVFQ